LRDTERAREFEGDKRAALGVFLVPNVRFSTSDKLKWDSRNYPVVQVRKGASGRFALPPS